MKKYIVLALLFLPMTSFAASSVRVLGSGSATPGATTKTTTVKKVVPTKAATGAKAATPSATATSGGSTGSRIGTIRTKAKVSGTTTTSNTTSGTSGTATTTTSGSGSRFPVITPAHSYSTVTKPQANNAGGGDVNLENYYNKQEVDDLLDDPRFDMIRVSVGNPESKWAGNPLLDKRKNEDGYVFMWIEE